MQDLEKIENMSLKYIDQKNKAKKMVKEVIGLTGYEVKMTREMLKIQEEKCRNI